MREKREPVLVLCDEEEEYAHLMSDYLRAHRELPWGVHTYTSAEKMMQGEAGCQIDLMVVAERSYREQMDKLHPVRTIILTECGLSGWENFEYVDKYQQAQHVLQRILEIYIEIADTGYMPVMHSGETCFVGIYSPVRRCFQTTFALAMSQMLAEKKRTLYLNFEHFCGISELAAEVGARDLADLLYFLMADKEKFMLRLQAMVQHRGSLDYIPPMKSGQNLLTVSAQEWEQLLKKIADLNLYQYVILDLSESMQGLFDILRFCTVIFTLTKEDRIAQGKLDEYERILQAYAYEDVVQKTRKYLIPQVRKIPNTLDQYTKGELADFIRKIIIELEGDDR